MALRMQEDALNPRDEDAGQPTNSDPGSSPAIDRLARESHLRAGDLEKFYVEEMAKLNGSARIKGFLPIFALRNLRKALLKRSVAKQAPGKPGGNPESGHPVEKGAPHLPLGQPLAVITAPAEAPEQVEGP